MDKTSSALASGAGMARDSLAPFLSGSALWPLFPAAPCLLLLASSSLNFASSSLLGGYFGKLEGSQGSGFVLKNSLFKAEAADPRSAGSIARRISKRLRAGPGKSLNVSATQRLYGCWGLKIVA
uniref:Uncharacterized protein n=1 Tax=Opuntia streptacantha TaxID=393608 RepID=A0A7C8Z5H8_OPUST